MTDKPFSILDYQQETEHVRGTISGRALNRANGPIPFKLYRDAEVFHLTHDLALPDIPLDQAHVRRPMGARADMTAIMAAICNLATGISRIKKNVDGTAFHFRSIPSAGALYPTELYFAIQNVKGINNGLYHYCPLEHRLTRIRSGYVFGALKGTDPVVRFYLTSIFHRSAWKYESRAYRYCLLDAGHVAENLVLACRMYGLPARLDYDFNDAAITRFLCIDDEFEVCLAQVHGLNCTPETDVDETVQVTADDLSGYSRCAPNPVAPDLVLSAHKVTSSFARCPQRVAAATLDKTTALPKPDVPASAPASMMKRRSMRNFIPSTVKRENLVDIISMLCHDKGPVCTEAVQVGFLASENSGLTPGYHRINRVDCSTSLVRQGDLMSQAARVCLDQGWLANCALHVVFTADLDGLNCHCGPRAYRYAQMEAGRLGERVYLSATAKGLGACGIGAFFDREAISLLSLPKGHGLLYLVGVGPVRK